MKGISAVIAVILLLLITISLVGFAFTFFTRTTETAAESGEQELEQQIGQIGTRLAVDNVNRNQVVIRNLGTVPLTNLKFYAGGMDVGFSGPQSLAPDAIGTYALNDSQLAMAPEPATLRVSSAGFDDSINTNFYLPTGNVAAYYKFDEGSGSQVIDSSGKENNGVLVNGPKWVQGRYGMALEFDGIDDYVEIPYSPSLDITQQITMEAWIKLNDVTGGGDQDLIINKEGIPYEIAIGDKGQQCFQNNICPYTYKYYFNWYLGNVAPFTNAPDGEWGWKVGGGPVSRNVWTHLLLSYNGTHAKVYINGNKVGDYTFTNPADNGRLIQTTSCTLRIGGRGGCAGTPGSFFNGAVDEVRIMNVARQP